MLSLWLNKAEFVCLCKILFRKICSYFQVTHLNKYTLLCLGIYFPSNKLVRLSGLMSYCKQHFFFLLNKQEFVKPCPCLHRNGLLIRPLSCSLIFKMLCAQWAQKLASVTSEDALGEDYFLWNSFLFFSWWIWKSHSNKIMYLFMADLGLIVAYGLFPSCGKQGLLFLVIYRLLSVVTSFVVEQGLRLRAQ